MKPYEQKLEDEFDGQWEIVSKYTDNLEWWADEIWELSSIWSPSGAKAYLTFLVDPMHDGNRVKGQKVWGLGCSKNHPDSRYTAESGGTISLGKSFKNHFLDFTLKLDGLRDVE
jgi:hypothetical protein